MSKRHTVSIVTLVISVLTTVALAGFVRAGSVTDQTDAGRDVPSGVAVFKAYCASCHGTGAKGDGPLADSLKIRPPDLTQLAKRNSGKFDPDTVYRIIDGRKPVKGHGGGDMPVWGDAFAASGGGLSEEAVKERITAIVKYLQGLQQN